MATGVNVRSTYLGFLGTRKVAKASCGEIVLHSPSLGSACVACSDWGDELEAGWQADAAVEISVAAIVRVKEANSCPNLFHLISIVFCMTAPDVLRLDFEFDE